MATVLVPTHSHGPLLGQAVGSALEQSISEIEIFIVGDGVDPLTRREALELCAQDKRVTFFDKEKGPRHGEMHRHEALREASGRIVCYLSDDDLWLPDHVSSMLDLLDGADFAHALPIGIRPDGSVSPWSGHLEVASSRDRVVAYTNFIPLSCGAHTLDRYRRLPFGWRTTPEEINTDVYMWSQILGEPECTARSGSRPTVLHFPSPWRKDMTSDERLEELTRWRLLLAAPDFEATFTSSVIDAIARERADKDEAFRQLSQRTTSLKSKLEAAHDKFAAAQTRLQDQQTQLTRAKSRLDEYARQLAGARSRLEDQRDQLTKSRSRIKDQQAQLTKAKRRLGAREAQLTQARSRIKDQQARLVSAKSRQEAYEARLQRQQSRLERMSQSFTWRTRERFLRLPGVARITRWAGEARSRRADD